MNSIQYAKRMLTVLMITNQSAMLLLESVVKVRYKLKMYLATSMELGIMEFSKCERNA